MQISVTIEKGNLKNFIDSLTEIKNEIGDMSIRLSEMIAKAFVARARKRLIAYTGQKRYSYYIKAVKEEDGHWSVRLNQPKYDPDIMYFLEYGTGFVGRESEQNPDKPSSWQYTINYGADWYGVMDINGSEVEGWYFNYQPNHFVQEEDGGYTNKRTQQRVIFTRGIKPVMYIYKTKIEIQDLLDKVKGKRLKISYKELKSRLNKIITGDIV